MLNLKTKNFLNFIFCISLIAIIFAFFIEYVLGHQPCNLCLIERIPYTLCLILIIIYYIFNINEKFLILLLTLIFGFSFFLSIYHFGIEVGLFEESIVCSLKNISETISKEEILKQLQEKTISCRDVTFRIFGFSLTTINMFLSLLLTILSAKIFVFYEK